VTAAAPRPVALAKRIAGSLVAGASPQCRYDRALFLLGHMRCGSTALSHVLCAHPAVSGYGEAHIRYQGPEALGLLLINQWRRGARKPGSRYLFDKILHARYDAFAPDEFFASRAVFLIREPEQSILSTRKLFAMLGTGEYATDEAAADYYEDRLTQLAATWHRFAPDRRIGLTYEGLTETPDATLQRISSVMELSPALANAYERGGKVMPRGAGDPLSSHKFNAIVPSRESSTLDPARRGPELSPGRLTALVALYRQIGQLFANAAEPATTGNDTK
jgi:hypothetical protein